MSEQDLLQAGFRYAFALTHHREDAEDLIQEAWLRLHRKYGAVKGNALLFATIRNLFIDNYRRRRLVSFEPLAETAADAQTECDAQSAESWARDIHVEDLDALLALMRPEEREALFLHAVEGYTTREIAKLCRCPRGTVLSLIHRAKHKLRKASAIGRNTN